MKRLFNAVSMAAMLAGAAVSTPAPVLAQATVSANWVQSAAQGPAGRAGAAMDFDSASGKSIMFGGTNGGSFSYFSDTWEFDGSAWSQLAVPGPAARTLALMAYDSSRGVSVLFGGYIDGVQGDTWEFNGSAWTQKHPAASPPLRLWSAMTYDSVRHVIVLFGGAIDTSDYNDTWEYDGNNWTQVVTAHSPPARRGHALAFDPLRGVTVLFGGQDFSGVDFNDTWEFNGSDWTQHATADSPSTRLFHSMVYDPSLGGAVMFGGRLASGFAAADTWLFDGSDWQQISSGFFSSAWQNRYWISAAYDSDRGAIVLFGGTPDDSTLFLGDTWQLQGTVTAPVDWSQQNAAVAPSPRAYSQMDFDSARAVSVLFGGSSDSGPGNLNDTWTWNGFSWTQLSPAVSPPAVTGGSMAYDSARGVSVLFGGDGNGGLTNGTWEFDGTNWTQRTFAVSPPAEVWGGMTYDSTRHRMVLFEGDPNSGSPAQTWEYDGTAWTQAHPASSPSARRGPAMAYDPGLGRTVLFGGDDATGRLADTWEWDGTNWTQIATASTPHPRFWATLTFDAQRGRTVLFGGDFIEPYSLGETNDTWEWNGAQWTRDWPTAAPARRSGHVAAYDSSRGRLVVFGGWNGAAYGDTWEFGAGIAPATGTTTAALSSINTDFGSVNVGSTAASPAAFPLSNTGTGPLTVNAITFSGPGDFTMTTDCPVAGNPLPAGSYCFAFVSFTPASAGLKTGTISFDYNAPGGNQTFQVQGTGLVIPTALSVSSATALYGGEATITASLTANGSAFSGQSVTLMLPNGNTVSTATDSSGVARFAMNFAGIHAGTYPTGIQASFAGTPAYAASSASASLTITQPVMTSYSGTFFVVDNAAAKVAITVDQRTSASDPRFLDYSANTVWARFTVAGASGSNDYYAQVADAADWAGSGLGVASTTLPLLPDGAYTVTATLVSASGSTSLSTAVAGDDARVGLASSPTKGGYLSGGGAIASDPAANTADAHGYFAFQMKPTATAQPDLVYVYRVRMDVGGGNLRDVDVWVTGADVTSLSGNGSAANAAGHFNVAFVDAVSGQRYSNLDFSGGTYRLSVANATKQAPAGFALVLRRPDGSLFHATAPVNGGGNAQFVPVVLGSLVSNL